MNPAKQPEEPKVTLPTGPTPPGGTQQPPSSVNVYQGELAVLEQPRYDEHGHELFPLSDLQITNLMADLNPNRIASRSQGGTKLSYMEGWDIKAMLTRIFGFGGWSGEVIEAKVLKIDDVPARKNGEIIPGQFNVRVMAQVTYRLHIHQLGATYTETAIASQNAGADPGDSGDFAIKTAETDGLKRCAIALGTAFGLSLYNKGATADVVQRVFAPGQRAIDVDLARLRRLTEDLQKQLEMSQLNADLHVLRNRIATDSNANANTGEVGPDEQMPDVPVVGGDLVDAEHGNGATTAGPEALADAATRLQGGFQPPAGQ